MNSAIKCLSNSRKTTQPLVVERSQNTHYKQSAVIRVHLRLITNAFKENRT